MAIWKERRACECSAKDREAFDTVEYEGHLYCTKCRARADVSTEKPLTTRFSELPITTTESVPGYAIDGYVGLVTTTQSQNKGAGYPGAAEMTEAAMNLAMNELRDKAAKVGATALIGLRVETVARSAGGTFGDAIAVTLIATGVRATLMPQPSSHEQTSS